MAGVPENGIGVSTMGDAETPKRLPDERQNGKANKKSRRKLTLSDTSEAPPEKARKLSEKFYLKEITRLQFELVKLQHWIQHKGLRVVLIFEGRDAAGKGGLIQRIIEPLNPRGVRLVALGKPSDIERTQWYFQRYVSHLPSAGEIVLFDRSWYNRAGVERVMGFCSEQEYWEFLRSCPEFERMLVRSGIILLKYYLSVSDEEQERRFQSRARDPKRRWKLSPIDLETRNRWVEYSRAKDIMLEHTDIPEARWYQIESDEKARARLNGIRHLLSMIPYEDVIPRAIELPPRPPADRHYLRPPRDLHLVIEDFYGEEERKKAA
jgi:polyphosphate kinase 2